MEQSDKAQRVLAIISAKADCEVEELKPENTWAEIGLDSLDTFELVMDLEKEFFISIPDEDIHNFMTVGDAIKYVEAH